MEPGNAQPSDLMRRLTAIRGKIRLCLLLYGACAVLAGGVGAFLTIILLDWWLWFPGALRIVVSLIFFTSRATSMRRSLVGP